MIEKKKNNSSLVLFSIISFFIHSYKQIIEMENIIRERENQIIKYEINSRLDLDELEKSIKTIKELEENVEKLEKEVFVYLNNQQIFYTLKIRNIKTIIFIFLEKKP